MRVCHSLMASKAKYCRDYEEVAASTTNRHSLDNLLKRNRGKTVAPAVNYMDLKLNIRTYCGLLCTIFGDHCDYYRELLKIYCILDRKECFPIWQAYTKEVHACITWAIVDNGRSFFGNPVASDFAAGTTFNFSVSYLEGIMDAVRNANPIQQESFPQEWLSQSTADSPYCMPLVGPPQPIEETQLLRRPRPRPHPLARHPPRPRRTCIIQKSNFLWICTLNPIATFLI
jgi:hypothetical protein